MPFVARRHIVALGAAVLVALALLFSWQRLPSADRRLEPWRVEEHGTAANYGAMKRMRQLRKVCLEPDPFEAMYGRTNLRMTRGYEGSRDRLQAFVNKILRGDDVTVAALGGSVTVGHGVQASETYMHHLSGWLNEFYPHAGEIKTLNTAQAATGSDYWSFCFPLHIPQDSDLVLIELGVNDEGVLEHIDDMENLIRGILEMPNRPAVVLIEALAFFNGGMGGGGGRMHLPVAEYYDVPVINQRNPLASHFARFPQLVSHYFARNYWGDPDLRHLGHRGHRDLTNLIASLLRDTTCDMISSPTYRMLPDASMVNVVEAEPGSEYNKLVRERIGPDVDHALRILEAGWPEESRSWMVQPERPKKDGHDADADPLPPKEYWPGMWLRHPELGMVPRLRVLENWDPNLRHREPLFQPLCLSTMSLDPARNLTPVWSEGWEHWTHPVFAEKIFLIGRKPGDRVRLEVETRRGIIKMNHLKSQENGLGRIRCWIDEDEDAGGHGVVIDGFWNKTNLNIGRYSDVADNLSPGRHNVTCEVLAETSDPGGGTEFRMIALVSL